MKNAILLFYILAATVIMSDVYSDDSGETGSNKKPNILFVLVDDVGYGDLGISGHPTVETKNLDWLAMNGRYFTRFYVTNPICSPSRTSIMTSKYAVRSGVYRVFGPTAVLGLPEDTTTLAMILKEVGYATHITGKWHLGVGRDYEYLPYNFGFDDGVITPIGNGACDCQKTPCFPDPDPVLAECNPCFTGSVVDTTTSCVLMNRTHILQQPMRLIETSDIFINDAISFMEQIKEQNNNCEDDDSSEECEEKPFFLYLSLMQGHLPLYNNEKYYKSSKRGQYGDQMNEIDGIVGDMIDYLKDNDLLEDTIIIFASDNGPVEEQRDEFSGSSLLFRCGKLTTAEGGLRVPGIAYWKDKIIPGKTNEMVSSMDIFPTLLSLIGESDKIPSDIDGIDQSALFLDPDEVSAREVLFGYSRRTTAGVDPAVGYYKQYKAHYSQQGPSRPPFLDFPPRVSVPTDDLCSADFPLTLYEIPKIYNLNHDPEEKYDLTLIEPDNTAIVDKMIEIRNEHLANIVWGPNRQTLTAIDAQVCCTDINDCLNSGNFPSCCDCPY